MHDPLAAHSDTPETASGRGRLRRNAPSGGRILRAVVGFASAGFLSLVLALVVIPALRLLPGGRTKREIRSQRAIHGFVRAYFLGLRILRIVRIQASGSEKLSEPGLLVVANHPTLIDALLLMVFMPQADCVIKGSHFANVFLGGAARGAGYVPNWDGPTLVADCVERLNQGRSLIIFPEGTRSPVGELGPFARGAAHIALRSGRDLVPVTIGCDPPTLYRGNAWWDTPRRIITLSLSVGEPVPIKDFMNSPMSRSRAARAVTAALRDHFEQRLGDTAQRRA